MWERHKILSHTSVFVGTCFFCSKFQNGHHKIEEEKTKKGNFFQSILRYLQVDLWKFYPQILAERRKIKGKEEVKVKLCETCQEILKEFGEIYVVFEETVLHLNAYISKIHEVMKCRQDCNAKEPDDDDDNELDTLREEIILKCEEKIRHALPRVRLERFPNLKRKFPASSSPPATSTSELPHHVKVESTEPDLSEEADDEFENPLSPALPPPSACNSYLDSSPKQERLQLPEVEEASTPPVNLVNNDESSKSQSSPSSPSQAKQNVRCALLRIRLGRLRNFKRKFPSTLPPELPDQIKAKSTKFELTENVNDLSEDIKISLSPPAPPSDQVNESNPDWCPEEDQLQEKIDDEEMEGTLQLQPSPSETLPHSPSPLSSSSLSLASNAIEPSPEVESVANDEESVNAGRPQLMCQHCGKAFQGQQKGQRLKFHLVIHHKAEFFPNVRKENVTQAEFIKMIGHVLLMSIKNDNCSLCSTVYAFKQRSIQLLHVKTHLLHKHRKTVEEALVKVQDNPDLLKTSFEIELIEDDESDQEDKPISESINGAAEGRQLLCQHCGKSFQCRKRAEKLKLHLVTYHREKFFPNLQKENVTRAKFKEMIDHVLHLCIKNDNCSLCPTVFKIKQLSLQLLYVRMHLLYNHRRTLEKALVKVQDNPDLLKTSFEIEEEDKKVELPPQSSSVSVDPVQLLCQHCRKSFQGPTKSDKLKLHLAIHHKDEFFPDIRKEDVTRAEFIEMIGHVLCMCIKKDNCSLCSTKYKITRRAVRLSLVRKHLLYKHQRTLEKALVRVQDNPDLLKTYFQIEEDEGDKHISDSINAVARQLLCQHCGKSFQGSKKSRKLKHHVVIHHKDEIFPNIRKENVSRAEFIKMINHVLLSYIKKYNCSLCSTVYKFENRSIQLLHVKTHLLHKHRKTLEDALVRVQDDPDLLERTFEIEKKEEDTSFIVSESINAGGRQLLCQYCGKTFEGSAKFKKHKVHLAIHHKDEFFPNIQKENVTQFEFRKMIDHILLTYIKKYNCSLCSTVYKFENRSIQLLNVKKHLLYKHQRTLEEALVKVQDNPDMLKTSFVTEEDEGDKPIRDSVNGGERQLLCQHCGKSFQGLKKSQKLKHHLVIHHKDEFFPNVRKENVTQVEFLKMIDHVLLSYMKNYNCSLCSTVYNNKNRSIQLLHVKTHLVHKHQRTLEEALVKFLDNPELLDTCFNIEEDEDDKQREKSVKSAEIPLLCQHCGKTYEGIKKTSKLKLHLVTNHRDEFFPNLRKENVTRAEFIEMIDHVILMCIKKDNCCLCSTVYMIKHRPMQILTVKEHLLYKHKQTLEKALIKVQNNPDLLETRFNVEEDEKPTSPQPIPVLLIPPSNP